MLTRNVCNPIGLPVAPVTEALMQVVQPPYLAGMGNEKAMSVGLDAAVKMVVMSLRTIEATSGGCLTSTLGAGCLRNSGIKLVLASAAQPQSTVGTQKTNTRLRLALIQSISALMTNHRLLRYSLRGNWVRCRISRITPATSATITIDPIKSHIHI